MRVFVSMLRGINVGGHNKIKMDALKALYIDLGLKHAQTFIQSGNVVFAAADVNLQQLSTRIEDRLAEEFGFRPAVILRSLNELEAVVARNPFADLENLEPGKLLVTFLATDPGAEVRQRLHGLKPDPELLWMYDREIYIYYPNGSGRSKLTMASLERSCNTPGTSRNWNTIQKLIQIAKSLALSL